MTKNILFLALNYPDIQSDNNMYTDLMEEFKRNGHKVYVVASASETGKTGLFNEGGVEVLRCKTYAHQTQNLLKKGISNIAMPHQYLQSIESNFSHLQFDLILLPTPPITLLPVVKRLKRKSNAFVYLILRDIFPQNAVDIGLLSKKSPFYYYFRNIEKKLYAEVDSIGCMSQKNIEYITAHNPSIVDKVHILRNWQNADFSEESHKENLKESLNLKEKFVVFYGGNMSKPQKISNLIPLIKEYQHNDKIIFYFIGKGTEKVSFAKKIEKQKLKNVYIQDALSRKEYNKILSIADVGLVTLDESFTIPNIPSKSISYLFSGIPILALVDKNTDFGPWVEKKIQSGFWTEATDIKKAKKTLDLLINSATLRLEMGERGKKYAHKHLTPQVAYKTILRETT